MQGAMLPLPRMRRGQVRKRPALGSLAIFALPEGTNFRSGFDREGRAIATVRAVSAGSEIVTLRVTDPSGAVFYAWCQVDVYEYPES